MSFNKNLKLSPQSCTWKVKVLLHCHCKNWSHNNCLLHHEFPCRGTSFLTRIIMNILIYNYFYRKFHCSDKFSHYLLFLFKFILDKFQDFQFPKSKRSLFLFFFCYFRGYSIVIKPCILSADRDKFTSILHNSLSSP